MTPLEARTGGGCGSILDGTLARMLDLASADGPAGSTVRHRDYAGIIDAAAASIGSQSGRRVALGRGDRSALARQIDLWFRELDVEEAARKARAALADVISASLRPPISS